MSATKGTLEERAFPQIGYQKAFVILHILFLPRPSHPEMSAVLKMLRFMTVRKGLEVVFTGL
jgi:hypothetical protein